jgi:chromate transporter
MESATASSDILRQLARLFFRLGATAFGGPAVHIAMMRDEVVQRREWMTNGEFMDLVAATNLIPGPNSTELAIHLGHRMAGWRALLVAGTAFILPAFFIVLVFAWVYVEYGTLPQSESERRCGGDGTASGGTIAVLLLQLF